jgi:hypothetical protein
VILLACAVLALVPALAGSGHAGAAAAVWGRLLWPLLRTIGLVTLGVFLGQLVQSLGLTVRLAALVRPLLRWGRFSTEARASFAMAFASGAAAHSMLADSHREGRIGRTELVLSALMNGQPSYLVHLPSTVAILLPLTGVAGLTYLGLTFTAAVLRTLLLLAWARLTLRNGAHAPAAPREELPRIEPRRLLQTLVRRLRRILLVVIPVYAGILSVEALGFFDWIREAIATRFLPLVLPVEAIGVVMLSLMAEFTSAAAAAGALLDSGVLTTRHTIVALLVGTILATPLRSLRHQIPVYTGIFSPRLGFLLVALSQTLRAGSVALVGLAYAMLG